MSAHNKLVHTGELATQKCSEKVKFKQLENVVSKLNEFHNAWSVNENRMMVI